MAIQQMVLTCDAGFCDTHTDEFETEDEAREFGWYFLYGPERDLGGKGERVFCSPTCIGAGL